MRKIEYINKDSMSHYVGIPDEAPDSHAMYGIVIGPPDLSNLELPKQVEVRLNNELFVRGLITIADVRKRRIDVLGALQSALAVDVAKVIEIYKET